MDRKEFLSTLGWGATFALTATCLSSCSKDEGTSPKDNNTGNKVDFTIDLNDSKFSALKQKEGFVIHMGVVIANDINGNFRAATVTCSHEQQKQIIYKNEEWQCTAHGARFSLDGSGLNANGNKGLKIYKTQLSGNSLRIFE